MIGQSKNLNQDYNLHLTKQLEKNSGAGGGIPWATVEFILSLDLQHHP